MEHGLLLEGDGVVEVQVTTGKGEVDGDIEVWFEARVCELLENRFMTKMSHCCELPSQPKRFGLKSTSVVDSLGT